MSAILETNSEIEQLQAQVESLTMERDRLIGLREDVLMLAMTAQSGNALHICNSIVNLARQSRETAICAPGCDQEHSPEVWARMLGKARITLYRWMDDGLHFIELQKGMKTTRRISHDDMRRFQTRFL